MQVRTGPVKCGAGEILADVGFAVLSGARAEDTSRVKGGALDFAQEGMRGIWAEGADGARYALVANFGMAAQAIEIFGAQAGVAAGRALLRGRRPAPT